jgi:hypothetical protein
MKLLPIAAVIIVAFQAAIPPVSGASLDARCNALPPLEEPLSDADVAAEHQFCNIDFDGDSIALCPKNWSTSPAALVYDLAGSDWQGRSATFESEVCPRGGSARESATRELAFFKSSLNGSDTSGTFAPASLLYYHLSRYLQTRVQIPVAVPVSVAISPYRERIVAPGLRYSAGGRTKMLHAGWLELDRALGEPATYRHRRELFDTEGSRLWGVLLMENGHRYGPELNGTRASGWGEGQNRDFQRTAPFIALRSDNTLDKAITRGLLEARRDPDMAPALPAGTAPAQIAWWMHELTEIVLLDYILGQQDRIGNIDYLQRWVWLEEGALRLSVQRGPAQARQLRVSVLNDNDAGVRSGYANYARSTGMLEGWFHMDPGLYRRLQALSADFRSEGAAAQAVRTRYRLSDREAQQLIDRGITAATYLRKRCEAGKLRFDLGLANVLDPARAAPVSQACE